MKYFKICAWIFFLSVSIAIFFFSSQTAAESSQVSGSLLHEILIRLVPGYGELPLAEQAIIKAQYQGLIRKAAHFSIYALWGMSLTLLLFLYQFGKKALVFTVTGGGLLYAICDELHQMFSNGRSAQISDVFLDFFGMAVGMGIFLLCSLWYYRKRKRVYYSKEI